MEEEKSGVGFGGAQGLLPGLRDFLTADQHGKGKHQESCGHTDAKYAEEWYETSPAIVEYERLVHYIQKGIPRCPTARPSTSIC